MQENQKNIAFVDGQNLHLGTTKHPDLPWRIDLARFRVYLTEKYSIDTAYYYLGYPSAQNNDLYEELQSAGFVIRFRDHVPNSLSAKKGNVDTDIVFDIMLAIYKNEIKNVLLVSGDGDYAKMVRFLVKEKKLLKLLFPNQKRASALYGNIHSDYKVDLSRPDMRQKIGQKERAG